MYFLMSLFQLQDSVVVFLKNLFPLYKWYLEMCPKNLQHLTMQIKPPSFPVSSCNHSSSCGAQPTSNRQYAEPTAEPPRRRMPIVSALRCLEAPRHSDEDPSAFSLILIELSKYDFLSVPKWEDIWEALVKTISPEILCFSLHCWLGSKMARTWIPWLSRKRSGFCCFLFF